MKLSYPYEKRSVRTKRIWGDAATKLGIDPIVLREYYFQRYFTGMEVKDYLELLISGEIEKPTNISFTPEEIAEKQKKWDQAAEESDFSDLLNWRLKEIIEVGDEIVSNETKTFLSGGEYATKGKRYRILTLQDEGGTGIRYTTTSNMKKEVIYGGVHGIRSLWRNGKEIWNWNLAYFNLFVEQNPGHEQTELMRVHCAEQAEKSRNGE